MKQLWELSPEAQRTCIEMAVVPSIGSGKKKIIGTFESGYSSDIYILHDEIAWPSEFILKTPKLKDCNDHLESERRIIMFEDEIIRTTRFCGVAWAQDYKNIEYFGDWPFALGRRRDGTLRSLIENPAAWSKSDKLLTLIQICRGLSQCYERGLAAHQDLKPENIFFDDQRRTRNASLPLRVYIGDFGAANGVLKSPPRNSGSRPYMAPEQYSLEAIVNPHAIDTFAVGVMIHEVMTDGVHPSGVRTADVWPAVSGKYKRQNYWQDWARIGSLTDDMSPSGVREVVRQALSPNPADRPSITSIETELWSALNGFTSEAPALSTLMDAYEGMYFHGELNGHMKTWLMRHGRDIV